MAKRPQPKVISTKYLIKVQGISIKEVDSLSEARKVLRNLSMPLGVSSVQLVKLNVTETILSEITPNFEEVLSIENLTLDI